MKRSFKDKFINSAHYTIQDMQLNAHEKAEAFLFLAIQISVCIYGEKGALKYFTSTLFVKFPFYDPANGNYLRFDTRLSRKTRNEFIHQLIKNFTENIGDIKNG